MRKYVLLLLAAVLVTGVAGARSFETGYQPEGIDELKKQKGVFSTVLVHPDTDFSEFSRIRIQSVALVIRDPAAANQFDTGRLLKKREKESVIPEYDEVIEFKRIVKETVAGKVAEDLDLEVVDDAGPGTLIVQPVVTDVEISSSSKNTSEDGRELPLLDEGVIVFDLMDGETGRILARFAEKKRNKPPKSERKTEGVWPNLPHWADAVASDLCEELRSVQTASSG